MTLTDSPQIPPDWGAMTTAEPRLRHIARMAARGAAWLSIKSEIRRLVGWFGRSDMGSSAHFDEVVRAVLYGRRRRRWAR